MAEGEEGPAAQLSGLLQVFEPQSMTQNGVQPGAWCGERGCMQTAGQKWLEDGFSGPRSLFIESHPWRPQSSPSSRAAQSEVSLLELSINDQAVPDSLVGDRSQAS